MTQNIHAHDQINNPHHPSVQVTQPLQDSPSVRIASTSPHSFHEEARRGPFAYYREAMNGTVEAPDTAHFSSLWAITAAWLRRRVFFSYSHPMYPNPYFLVVGTTGNGKTSAMHGRLQLLPQNEMMRLLRGVGSAEG